MKEVVRSGDCASGGKRSRIQTMVHQFSEVWGLRESGDFESYYVTDCPRAMLRPTDRGGIVRGNRTHAEMSCEGRDHAKRTRPKVLKQVVERGEEATTSPEGLSYPKAKRQLERRWTRRSATVPQKRIY
ncbi:hypothetical protein B296_00032283 [Ensete ventricosum]|uniref:Uncharacterized protein n=1 Tax=Ensete ventricosum TaxID=4639 RepID=A0A426X2K0_ENSVE|nr:hypothetical protein B296_00032283 [Ensete ventricosum]